jgi:phage terminase large subunit-like protein
MLAIQNPILQQSFEADWYFPPTLPEEITSSPLYEQAVEQGWHEWIETPLDFEAMKHGFIYDLSRDIDNKPIYWIDGGWQTATGDRISVEDEFEAVAHVGRGDHTMRFAETFLYHTKAPLDGKPYRFLPWMRKIAAPLYGWVHKTTRLRRYQSLYCAIGKKNGKSALLSVLANYMLVGDGTPKAQVYSCACDRNQARIIYDEAAHMVRGSDTLSDIVTIVDSRARLVHHDSGSFYAVLSADAHRNDGLDSSCTLVDEIHRHPNRKLYTVMERAGQARPEPLLGVITTYGPSLGDGSIWAEIHNEAKAQMRGERPSSWRNMVFVASAEPIQVVATEDVLPGSTVIPVSRLEQPIDTGEIEFDLSHIDNGQQNVTVTLAEPAKRFQDFITVEPLSTEVPKFSEATANEDWRTEHAVRRANPSVDVVFPMDRLMKKIEESRSPEKEAETRQLNLNIVSGSGRRWISTAAWVANKHKVQPKNLVGRHCFGGLDFSFGGDLVGFGLAFPSWDAGTQFINVPNPRIDLLTWAWLPDEQITEREEVEQFPYRHHAKQPYLFDDLGCVRFCKGRVVDFPQIINEILAILKLFQVVAIAYDPNYQSFGIPKIEEQGYTCVAHRQGAVSMSPPCKRFSELVYKGQLAHGDNPLLSRAVEGAVLHPPDKAGNTYLSKGNSHCRIDVLVADVMAVGYCCDPPVSQSGAYSDSSSGVWG